MKIELSEETSMRLLDVASLFACVVLLCLPMCALAEKVELVAGGGKGGDGGLASEARLVEPFGVGFDAADNLYIVEMEGGERVRKIDSKGIITTVVGTGEKGFSGDGGPAAKAQINGAHHLLVLPDGDILVADTWNNRVRQVDHRTGTITTIAGTGVKGFSGDGGPAAKAEFGGIYCLALSPKSDVLYICDLDNRRIRALNRKTGTVSTVAGNGQRGVPEDGQKAVEAPLADPRAVTVDSKGNLYILERGGNALRMVDTAGTIRTLIGGPKHKPSAEIGDLSGPKHLCVDRQDKVFLVDTENHRILKYDPRTGQIQKVAGTGKAPAPETPATAGIGGTALDVPLNRPHGVFVRRDGTLYIADSSNGRVLRVRP
jgi:sugar lactone lactonase YvrE